MTQVNRFHQGILVFSTLLGSWIGMQALHESGHMFGAWLTGGRVTKVVLNPLTFSRTDLNENPRPLVVAWAGPVVGVLAPLLIWRIAASTRLPGAFVLRFFAGFCLLANGLYLGIGTYNGVGDCNELLRYGSASWQLWLFGLATVPAGIWLWHRQGPNFGFGAAAKGIVRHDVTYLTATACVVLVVLGFVVGGN
jgi:hypothetical protein